MVFRWLYFHEDDGDITVEFIKTDNGTSCLLREAAIPVMAKNVSIPTPGGRHF